MKKVAGYLAMASLFAATGAMATVTAEDTDEGEIEVRSVIHPFIELNILDSTLDWSAPNFTSAANDLTDNTTRGVGRALFSVRANTAYSLTVTTADGCWNASNLLPSPEASFRQVRFVHEANGDWIGGKLFLDRHPDSPGFTHDWNNDGGDCRISTDAYAAETHTWGLGASFRPSSSGTRPILEGFRDNCRRQAPIQQQPG
jgi:hypothetical protein